jgi:beta-1,4-mannosyl-glycoprotein beta-1,4-N-acetylglucosaminyltransferase
MNYLYEYVDHFVLVESALTHSGNPKPFYFEQNKHLFAPYLDKIVHVKIYDDIPKPFKLSFIKYTNLAADKYSECINRGNFQRNCISRGLAQLNLQDNDIIISGDADEFVDRTLLQQFRRNGIDKVYGLEQQLYYYNLTCRAKAKWDLARAIPYRYYQVNTNLAAIRGTFSKPPNLPNGGWHFSYFGNIEFIIDKIKQSADQSMNNEKYLNITFIQQQIQQGKDLFGRSSEEFEIIPIEQNTYLPEGYAFLNDLTK